MLRKRLQKIAVSAYGVSSTAEWIIDNISDDELKDLLEEPFEEMVQTGRLPHLRKAKEVPTATPFSINLSLPMYSVEQVGDLVSQNKATTDDVMTVCCSGHRNWVEKGVHITDALGYIVLPENVDLPDDPKA